MSLKNRVLLYLTFCYFFIFMSTRLFFVCLFLCPSVCLSVHKQGTSVCLSLSIGLFVCPSVCLSVLVKNTHTPGTNKSIN